MVHHEPMVLHKLMYGSTSSRDLDVDLALSLAGLHTSTAKPMLTGLQGHELQCGTTQTIAHCVVKPTAWSRTSLLYPGYLHTSGAADNAS